MTLIDAVILGVVQGLTEFLPISSSGHLVLAESFLKLNVQDLKSFDIAVNLGTLLAIFLYFWKDFAVIIHGCIGWLFHFIGRKREHKDAAKMKESQKLVQYLVLGTIPVVIVGAFFGDFLQEHFRQPFTVALLMIVVGVFFFVAEYIATKAKAAELNQTNTFVVGAAQSLALLPGVSRSGATISAGLVQGVKREEAARFSFLLGAVAMTAALLLSVYKVWKGSLVLPSFEILTTGILASFASGYFAIGVLLKFLKKHTLHVFGVYRVVLGFILLYLLNFTHLLG
jgi:undecaprenyl-diphosphatase